MVCQVWVMMMPRRRGRVMIRWLQDGLPQWCGQQFRQDWFQVSNISLGFSISGIDGFIILQYTWYVWLNVCGTLLYASVLKQQNTLTSTPRFHTPTMNPTAGIASRSHTFHQPKTKDHEHQSQHTPLHPQLLATSFL